MGVNDHLRVSADCVAFVKHFESGGDDPPLVAYLDTVASPPVWTIGHGHTQGVHRGMRITKAQAEQLLTDDLEEYGAYVRRAVKVPLSQQQYDALVPAVMNLGPGEIMVESESTLLRELNAGNYDAVPAQLVRWDMAGGVHVDGLTRRRLSEGDIWAKGDYTPRPDLSDRTPAIGKGVSDEQMSDYTDKIKRLKERRKETRDDLERSQRTLTDLNDRREHGEKGLTPKIESARQVRDKREVDWRNAKKAVRECRKAEDGLDITPGAPHWGGAEDILLNEVIPVAARAGISRNSGKRTATYGNPGSDHHVSQTVASAADFPTANNFTLRNQIMKALGVTAVINDYGNYTIEREGHRFRVQPIAGTHGTGPHLHIGIRRI